MRPERVGRFKVRGQGGQVTSRDVYREGRRHFILLGRENPRRRVYLRRVSPPEDYPHRRTEGLIEWEVQ